MTSRKRIEDTCEKQGVQITSLEYVRGYIAVPEELIPVGWVLQFSTFDDEGFEEVVECAGSVDDIIAQLSD